MKCAPTLSDSSFPLHQEHNSINRGLANGRLTACDADLIREFIAESQSCNNISAGRTNKIVFTLVGWRRFIGPYLENSMADIYQGISALKTAISARGKPFKQNTIADHIIILKRFYGWAIENGHTDLPDRKIRRLKIPTKDTMTKEAAALETVAAMGLEQFTIKMLQEAIGLSYQQTYRILNGYASCGATHSGLLEKCPAVSYFDTMVTEDGEGYAVESVELENRGFDLISRRFDPENPGVSVDVRFIEVKGRAGTGDVFLTENEYRTATRLKNDYWLYVVYNCASTPEVRLIRDPVRLGWKPVVTVEHYQAGKDAILRASEG